MSSLDSLYPGWIESVPVSASFPIPRFPTRPAVRNETSVRSFYGDRLLRLIEMPSGEAVGFIDKLFPHSRYDAMILAASDDICSSVSDIRTATLRSIFDAAAQFPGYVARQASDASLGLDGAQVHIAFNYSPDTIDRQNSQFYDKRFHLHLNCWPGRDLEGISSGRFGDLADNRVRRRLVDPVALLGAQLVVDASGGEVCGRKLIVPDGRIGPEGAPIGLHVALGSWAALAEKDFAEFLQALHDVASDAYRAVRGCFVGAGPAPGPWQRPTLRPLAQILESLDNIPWLGENSRALLEVLARSLRNVTLEELQRMKNGTDDDALELSLNGLDYSVGIYSATAHSAATPISKATDVTLVVHFRLFGDVGGAGLPPLRSHAAVRLDRKNGPEMTAAEVADRTRFGREFVESVENAFVRLPTTDNPNPVKPLKVEETQ